MFSTFLPKIKRAKSADRVAKVQKATRRITVNRVFFKAPGFWSPPHTFQTHHFLPFSGKAPPRALLCFVYA
jgi:hypothetical protein